MRVIPEWPELDNEIKAIEKDFFAQQQQKQGSEDKTQDQEKKAATATTPANAQQESLNRAAEQIL